jgi:AraC-type transcriptional regulator N-terminus
MVWFQSLAPQSQYLGLVMALDRAIMQETVEEDWKTSASCQQNESSRLIRLQETPEAISTLYPGIMPEVCYWLPYGTRSRSDQLHHDV